MTSVPYYHLHDFATDPRLENFQRSSRYDLQASNSDAADNVDLYDGLSREVNDDQQPTASLAGPGQDVHHPHHHIDGLEDFESAINVRSPFSQQDNVPELPQEQHKQLLPRTDDRDTQQKTAEEVVYLLNPGAVSGGVESRKRKRGVGSPQIASDSSTTPTNNLRFKHYGPPKRRKLNSEDSMLESSTVQLSTEEEIHSYATAAAATATVPSDDTIEETSFFVTEYPPNAALTDARAAGVYSAAALFRKPSSNAKKYTRPPMSKLFSSLLLTPENFLRLQAAAKTYMLNADYPDRQSCVGNRGKGDTDMTKLRLYNCVKEFLEEGPDGGYGVVFFGKDSEGRKDRSWEWPTHVNRVISLCTPLLRRMVTNERQRQYAIDSRKSGSGGEHGQNPSSGVASATKKVKGGSADNSGIGITATNVQAEITKPPISVPPGSNHEYDFNPMEPEANISTSIDPEESRDGTWPPVPVLTNPPMLLPAIPNPPLCLDICFLSTGNNDNQHQTMLGHFNLPDSWCQEYNALRSIITMALSSSSINFSDQSHQGAPSTSQHPPVKKISTLTPRGLVSFGDQASWTLVREEVETASWMQGQMKILVEVGGDDGRSGSGSVDDSNTDPP